VITRIEMLGDPGTLAELDVELVRRASGRSLR
jgi:hypothetical protein